LDTELRQEDSIIDASWGMHNGVPKTRTTRIIDGKRTILWHPFPFKPNCFCYLNDLPSIEASALSLGYKVTRLRPETHISWDDRPVAMIECVTPDDVSSFRNYVYQKYGIKLLEADVKWGDSVIIELDLKQDPIQEHFMCYIDIETDPRSRSSITELDRAEARVLSCSIRDRDGNVVWLCEKDELLLFEKIKSALARFASTCSWSEFDMKYLLSRARRLGIYIGPLNMPAIDLMNLYSNIVKRSTGGRMFVSLEQACKECKIEMRDYGVKSDITLVWKYFQENWAKLREYNDEDTRAIFEIDKKLQLTASRFQLTQMFNIPLKATQYNSQIIDLVALRLARKRPRRVILPSKPVTFMTEEEREKPMGGKFVGAVVIEPTPGIKEYVGVFDFAALYPNIIKSLNIGIETLCTSNHADHIDDVTYHATHANYHIDMDSIPRQIVKLADAWKAEANKMYDAAMPGTVEKFKAFAVKRASKVLLVSLYGVLGSPVCRMFNINVAESIAGTGRTVILDTKAFAEMHGWVVLYGDTDSIFIKFKSTTLEECLVEANDVLVPLLNKHIQEFVRMQMGAHEVTLEMELDQVYSRLLIGRGSKKKNVKKRYAGRCRWEKQMCDYIYIVGFEIVRRDWTKLAQRVQKHVLNEVLNVGGTIDEVWQRIQPFIEQTKTDLYSGKLNEEIMFWRALPRPIEEYQGVKKGKGIPPHVRVAIELRNKGLFEQRTPFSYVVIDDQMTCVPVIDKVIPHISIQGYDYYWNGQVQAILFRLGFNVEPKKGRKSKRKKDKHQRQLQGYAVSRRHLWEYLAEFRHVNHTNIYDDKVDLPPILQLHQYLYDT